MQMATRPALPEIKAGDVWNLIKNRKEDSAEEAVEMTVNETLFVWHFYYVLFKDPLLISAW